MVILWFYQISETNLIPDIIDERHSLQEKEKKQEKLQSVGKKSLK